MSYCKLLRTMFLAVSVVATSVALADESTPPEPKTQNGIAYLTGGIGQDEVRAMRAEAKDGYNLQLVFATEKSGQYQANVKVSISDAKGKKLIDAISEGPGFYAKLPVGRYRINAEAKGTQQSRSIEVTGHNLNRFVLYWPAEAGQLEDLH
jgi:hypothetical protein